MLASFVIGFHTARIDNLLQTLRFLVDDHAEVVKDCYLEAVCQDCVDVLPPNQYDELDIIRESFHRSCITSLNLKHMHLPFVTNHGIENAETDKIIVLESDRILPKGYFASVIAEMKEGVQITCGHMKKLTHMTSDEDIKRMNFIATDEYRSNSNEIGMRNAWSGNTAIMRQDWEKSGRMDETYKGYGWADTDMTCAMEKAGIHTLFRPEIELHLWHSPATYGEGDQKQMFIDNGLYFCKKWGRSLPDWFREEIAKHKKVML
jgi:hypothetical protein